MAERFLFICCLWNTLQHWFALCCHGTGVKNFFFFQILFLLHYLRGFPGGSAGRDSTCNVGDSVSPWVGKIPWRRECQPTPVFLPGAFHGQRSLVGCSPWGHKELGTTEVIYLNVCWLRSAWSSQFSHTHTPQSHLYSFEICILQPEILDALVVVSLLSFIYWAFSY